MLVKISRMPKPTSIKIECPICEKTTDLIILKQLNKDEHKDELDWMANNTQDMIKPELTKQIYNLFRNQLKDDVTTDYVIGKIKSHKLGLFGEDCKISNKTFKVLFYYFMNHKEQLGGYTFRIGEEIKYSMEWISFAEKLSKYCTTLNKESISIVFEVFGNFKKFTLTGDVAFFLNVSKWHEFQSIAVDSTLNPEELKNFITVLRDRLEENGEEVRVVVINNKLFTIECFKNNDWYQCVVIAAKGYVVNQ